MSDAEAGKNFIDAHPQLVAKWLAGTAPDPRFSQRKWGSMWRRVTGLDAALAVAVRPVRRH
jgi:hypothetical protein